jgi:hypothetical protein
MWPAAHWERSATLNTVVCTCRGNNVEQVIEKAQQALPGLKQWVQRLLALANETLTNVRYSEEDHLGFMALCFLSKQVDHLQSIVTLIPNRDAILVARSMIEGLCQLLWAAQEPKTLPLQWRAFAWVHDWRLMQTELAQDRPVAPARRIAIEEALQKYGDQFLTKQARVARQQGTPLPLDPYHDNWRCGRQLRQICEAVGGATLYQQLYEPFSDWHHWGVGGLGAAIVRQDNRVVYSSLSAADAATALAGGFQCLLQTVELTDTHLNVGLASQISELRNDYILWHQTHRD